MVENRCSSPKRVLAHLWISVSVHCHDAAHNAFMTLPPYTRTREGEARQLASDPKPCWLAL
jgi:hypothetical protein